MQHEAEMRRKNEEIRQKNAKSEQIQVVLNPSTHPSSFSHRRPIRHDCDSKGYMQYYYATSLSKFPYIHVTLML